MRELSFLDCHFFCQKALLNLLQKTKHLHEILSPPFLCVALSACVFATLPARLPAPEKPSMQSRPFQEKLAALLDDERSASCMSISPNSIRTRF